MATATATATTTVRNDILFLHPHNCFLAKYTHLAHPAQRLFRRLVVRLVFRLLLTLLVDSILGIKFMREVSFTERNAKLL